VFGFELAQPKARVSVFDFMAQHAERAEGSHFFVGGVWVGFVELIGNTF
jgi:hypothetical protein